MRESRPSTEPDLLRHLTAELGASFWVGHGDRRVRHQPAEAIGARTKINEIEGGILLVDLFLRPFLDLHELFFLPCG